MNNYFDLYGYYESVYPRSLPFVLLIIPSNDDICEISLCVTGSLITIPLTITYSAIISSLVIVSEICNYKSYQRIF